jgi:hypothetical protein
MIAVSNPASAGPTSGTVTATDTLPTRGPALAPSRAYGPLSARRKRRTPSAALGSLVEASRTYGGELQVGISCSSGHALDLVIQETGIDDPDARELLKRHPLRD